ncbi:MAG: TetR/AcrR family transcriptional regulator [Rubrivivax sp.]|nr:TetR/AcrR family transcriptional regulator [Rubrivivax sp.]
MPKPETNDVPVDLKEACVRAAHGVIAEHGLERLSLREVARRLGVSHQAPYKHYPSRDHLLAEVIRRCFRQFADYLDDRGVHADPREDLGALGHRYLLFAAEHPLEYRLMFGTPWPAPAGQPGLVEDARHALEVLRTVLRRLHGAGRAQRTRVDLDAMFIWSQMHGLASITQANVMDHLGLVPQASRQMVPHAMHMLSLALGAALVDPGVLARGSD